MANQIPVQLVVSGDVSDLSSKLAAINQQLRGLNGGGGGGMFDAGTKSAESFQQSLRGLIGRFSALWAVMKSGEGIAATFNTGIKFNAAIEDARLGIGSLITAQGKLKDSSGAQLDAQQSLTAAMAMGDDQIQKLRISGLQTAATTEQLVSAYQDAVGGGLRAGMSLDQIRVLTVQTVQAAGAMGVPMNQLNQEIRSILDGTIDRNSRVAIRLGITNADVEKWKQAGTLFQELNLRMMSFSEAGKESMNNWTVLLSNMAEASQILLGDAFRDPMKNIKAALNDVMGTIININTAQIGEKVQPVMMMLKDIGNLVGDFAVGTIRAISGAVMSMGEWWAANRDAITGALASFKLFIGEALGFIGKVAGSILKFFADWFLWLTQLPEVFRSAAIAASIFTASLWAMNSSLAGGITAGITKLVAIVGNLGQVMQYTRAFGMQGFIYSIGTMINPVTLVVAGVVALGAATYYLASSASRAAAGLLEMRRQSLDVLTSFNSLLPTLKDIDDRMKESIDPKNTVALKARDDLRTQGIKDLIKYAPEQLKYIEAEIKAGEKLADIWLKVAENKIKDLKVDQAKQALKITQAELEAKVSPKGAVAGVLGAFISPGTVAAEALKAKSRLDAVVKMKEELKLIDEAIEKEEKLVNVQKLGATITPNNVANEKALKLAERRKAAQEQLDILLQDAAIKSMPHITEEQRRQVELAKADLDYARERERIRKLAATANKPAADYLRLAEIEFAQRRDEINAHYTAKRENAEEAWYAFVRGQEGDSLNRKLANIATEMAARAKAVKDAGGMEISATDRFLAFKERKERETIAFREGEVKQLEAALRDLEKTKGRALTFDEQIPAIEMLAEKLKKSAEAVQMLGDKLGKIDQRKQSWTEGLRAGLLEVANTIEDRFTRMRNLVTQVAAGMRSAFSTAIQGMLNGSMSLSQGLKAIWKGITDTIIKAVADMVAQFLVAQIAQFLFQTVLKTTSSVGAAAAFELAVMESWAAYAGIPFYGAGLAMAQIAMITASWAAAKAAAFSTPSGAGTTVASEGMNYTGYATGGLVTKPGFIAENPYSRELVAPEASFLDWIKNVASPAIGMPSGNFSRQGGGELAFAGGGKSTVVQASFDGALIIGDSTSGLKKAAKMLRVIRTYDDRMNA